MVDRSWAFARLGVGTRTTDQRSRRPCRRGFHALDGSHRPVTEAGLLRADFVPATPCSRPASLRRRPRRRPRAPQPRRGSTPRRSGSRRARRGPARHRPPRSVPPAARARAGSRAGAGSPASAAARRRRGPSRPRGSARARRRSARARARAPAACGSASSSWSSTIAPSCSRVSASNTTSSSIRLRNSGRKRSAIASCERMFEVMITTALRKSTVRPWPSVRRPSSSSCRRTSNTSACAFSISSSRITQ